MKIKPVLVVLLSTCICVPFVAQDVRNVVTERDNFTKQNAEVVGGMDEAIGTSEKVKGAEQLELHKVRFLKPMKGKGQSQRVFRRFRNVAEERDLAALKAVLNPYGKKVYRPLPQWVDIVAGQNIPAIAFREVKPNHNKIDVEGKLVIAENAARFRMRCEGNLARVKRKNSKTGNSKFEWKKHWSAQVETVTKSAHTYCLENPSDFGEDVWKSIVEESFAQLVKTPPQNPKSGHLFFVHMSAPLATVASVREKLTPERHYVFVVAHGMMFSAVSLQEVIDANATLIKNLGLKVEDDIPAMTVQCQIVKNVLRKGTLAEKEKANKDKVVEKVVTILIRRHAFAKKYLKELRNKAWRGLNKEDWKSIASSANTKALIRNAINSKIVLRDAEVTHRELIASTKFGKVPAYASGNSIQIGNCFGHGKDLVPGSLTLTKNGVEITTINYASAWRRYTVTVLGTAVQFHVSGGPYAALKKAKKYHADGWKVVLVP